MMYVTSFEWYKIWLESNSIYVITLFWIQSFSIQWRWYSAWVDCLKKIYGMEFHYSHISKEGNVVVDNIASKAPSICTVT